MNKVDIDKLIKDIFEILEDKELSYIENDELYNEVLKIFNELNQQYIQLYIEKHNNILMLLRELLNKLESSPTWNLILILSSNSNKLKQAFNKLYFINKIIAQNKMICEASGSELTTALRHYETCQKCKRNLESLENIIDFEFEIAKNDIYKNFIEKMKDSVQTSALSKEFLEKYRKEVDNTEKKIENLVKFIEQLDENDKKVFMTLIQKFFEGRDVEVLNLEEILDQIKIKKTKYYSVKSFIKALEQEISDLQKKIPESNKKEWIIQL